MQNKSVTNFIKKINISKKKVHFTLQLTNFKIMYTKVKILLDILLINLQVQSLWKFLVDIFPMIKNNESHYVIIDTNTYPVITCFNSVKISVSLQLFKFFNISFYISILYVFDYGKDLLCKNFILDLSISFFK